MASSCRNPLTHADFVRPWCHAALGNILVFLDRKSIGRCFQSSALVEDRLQVVLCIPMPNGCRLCHCAHCERWLACHPWGDPARFYCDDCSAWWDAWDIWWQLNDVFLVQQAGQDIQRILSDDHLGCLISSYLTWHDVTGYGAWASDRLLRPCHGVTGCFGLAIDKALAVGTQ